VRRGRSTSSRSSCSTRPAFAEFVRDVPPTTDDRTVIDFTAPRFQRVGFRLGQYTASVSTRDGNSPSRSAANARRTTSPVGVRRPVPRELGARRRARAAHRRAARLPLAPPFYGGGWRRCVPTGIHPRDDRTATSCQLERSRSPGRPGCGAVDRRLAPGRIPETIGDPSAAGASVSCPSCGHANLPSHRFCSECGTPVPPACHVCGALRAPTARFCVHCGAGFGEAVAEPPASRRADDGERRHLTVMFCDVVASTELAARLDP
jgi:hypothetical protein